MTRTPLSRSKGQGHQAALVGCTGNMDIELVTDPDAYMMYIVSSLASLGGAYCGGLLPTACFGLGLKNLVLYTSLSISMVITFKSVDRNQKHSKKWQLI